LINSSSKALKKVGEGRCFSLAPPFSFIISHRVGGGTGDYGIGFLEFTN